MFGHLLDSPRTKYLASLISLSLGLFFTFVWAPHPWPWEGIDRYHDLARDLARGAGFNTTDVPWGYAYYVALFYRIFGEHPLPPILGQVLLNAASPLLVHAIVRPLSGPRTATLAALLTGVFSFNTIYTSTLMSDTVCNVIFLVAVLCFFRAHASGSWGMFAVSGLLLGVASQFRPNLVLLPGVVAVAYVIWSIRLKPDTTRTIFKAAAFFIASIVPIVPWVVRNYQLAGVFLPTSSHGAIQLWYGSLQVGRYLEDYSANPRAALEKPPYEYTSLTDRPVVVSIDPSRCEPGIRSQLAFTYSTDRAAAPIRLEPRDRNAARLEFQLPGQPDDTDIRWRVEPSLAGDAWSSFLVTTDHRGDRHPAIISAGRRAMPDCVAGRVRFNDVFYLRELHNMNRFAALAWDNIRREPLAFAAAALYRSVRLFIIRPGGDGRATYRFTNAGLVYATGLVLSLTYLIVFLAGVAVAWRRRSPLLALLLPIVYVPVTICVVLTNQRYSVTMQPLMFAFMALAIVTAVRKDESD